MRWAPESRPGKMEVPREIEGWRGEDEGVGGERGEGEGVKIKEEARTRWGV